MRLLIVRRAASLSLVPNAAVVIVFEVESGGDAGLGWRTLLSRPAKGDYGVLLRAEGAILLVRRLGLVVDGAASCC